MTCSCHSFLYVVLLNLLTFGSTTNSLDCYHLLIPVVNCINCKNPFQKLVQSMVSIADNKNRAIVSQLISVVEQSLNNFQANLGLSSPRRTLDDS